MVSFIQKANKASGEGTNLISEQTSVSATFGQANKTGALRVLIEMKNKNDSG
jgi:hypothetical protein